MPIEPSRRVPPEATVWPLVGRDEELARIDRARSDPAVRGVVLGAPAGVGKTRLARDAVAVAERDGALVTWVHATRSAATVPLGALAALLPPDLHGDGPLERMRRTAEALAARAGGRPVVLGVDDAQLLDPASAALVLHLVTTGTVFVVATVRTSDPAPDAVRALWKDAGAVRLDLRALSEDETRELVESVLGGPAGHRAHRWIFQSSQGNVLYLRELLLGALADGALAEADGLWRLERTPPPSRSLAELVTARMTDLADAERRVVELLALGEPLRLDELGGLAGTEPLAVAEDLGLVTVAGTDARLAHPLYGEVVRASMPVMRGLELRRALADTVGARAQRAPGDALRIAGWLLDGGDTPPLDLLVEAAAAAIPAGDHDLADRLARMALDAGAGPETAMLLARAHAARGRLEDAAAVLAGIEGTFTERGVALEYLQQCTVVLFYGLQRGEEALALVGRARSWWDDPAWERTLYPARVRLTGLTSGFAAGAELGGELLADTALDAAERRRLEIVMLPSLFYSGRAREAYEIVVRHRPAVPLRDESDFLACIMSCIVAVESGLDIAGFGGTMHEEFAQAIEAHDRVAAGVAAVTIGVHHMLGGRHDDAARWLAESADQLASHDPFSTRKSVHALQALVAWGMGDVAGVAGWMRRCWELVGERRLVATDRSYIVRGAAALAMAESDPPRAQAMLVEASDELGEAVPIYAAQLLHEAMRMGARAKPLVARVETYRSRSDAPLVELYADHIAARAARDGARLLDVAERFAALEATRYGSEAAAHAAEAFGEAGREDSARRAAARSRELHALGQGGAPPEIRGLDPGDVLLTRREAQLVELAASGLTNAEIADRLVLSVRTVESHVYRAMQKLGVSDRRDL